MNNSNGTETSSDSEINSEHEVERLDISEELNMELIGVCRERYWELIRKMFHHQISIVRLTVVMGLLFSFVVYSFNCLSHAAMSNDGTFYNSALIIWMLATGFTWLFSFTAWFKVLRSGAWRTARHGDVIDGVVVDTLALTFIGDYVSYIKELFKRYAFLSGVTSCLLLLALQVAYLESAGKVVIGGGVSLYSVLFFGLIGIAGILTIVVIKFGTQLYFADREIISRY